MRTSRRLSGEELRSRVVFIGGAIAPLLQTDPPFEGPRPTKDVDAIVVTVSYSDFAAFSESLRRRGFRECTAAAHAHSWLSPGEGRLQFDVVPAGNHFGASGNIWDEVANRSAVDLEIRHGVWIRHANAPAFIALKLGAFGDRGEEDPFGSHDLEDILALVASRPGIVTEVRESEVSLRNFVAEGLRAIVVRDEIRDLISAHLANVLPRDRRAAVFADVYARLETMAFFRRSPRGVAGRRTPGSLVRLERPGGVHNSCAPPIIQEETFSSRPPPTLSCLGSRTFDCLLDPPATFGC